MRYPKAPSQLSLETRSHPRPMGGKSARPPLPQGLHFHQASLGGGGAASLGAVLRPTEPPATPGAMGSSPKKDQAVSGLGACRPGQGRDLGVFHHPESPRKPRHSCLGEAHECQACPTLTVDPPRSVQSSQTRDPERSLEGQGWQQPWAPRSAHPARCSPGHESQLICLPTPPLGPGRAHKAMAVSRAHPGGLFSSQSRHSQLPQAVTAPPLMTPPHPTCHPTPCVAPSRPAPAPKDSPGHPVPPPGLTVFTSGQHLT